jgi:OTU domain-containing protein 6
MTNNDALETLLARHKKEQRSLVAQATALKKSVAKGEKAKKKEVLSEIQRLEDVLKSQHKKELAELRDSTADSTDSQSSNDSTLHTSAQDSELPMIQALSSNRESSPPKVELKGSGGKPKVNRQKARMVFTIPDYS